jgi:hypothetical protein
MTTSTYTRKQEIKDKSFLKLETNVSKFIQVTSELYTRPANEKQVRDTQILNCIDLGTGEDLLFQPPAVLLSKFERFESLTGLKFEVVRGEKVPGKNYIAHQLFLVE